jgi:hypothetical protein
MASQGAGHRAIEMNSRDTRREQNQMRFRRANEGFHDAVQDHVRESQRVPFLCECADDDCFGTVNVLPSEWEAVAAKPNHFLMEAGHQQSEGEEVVGSLREYEIARKPE